MFGQVVGGEGGLEVKVRIDERDRSPTGREVIPQEETEPDPSEHQTRDREKPDEILPRRVRGFHFISGTGRLFFFFFFFNIISKINPTRKHNEKLKGQLRLRLYISKKK